VTAKADRVKALLNDEHVQQAFQDLEDWYTSMLKDAPVNSDADNVTLILDIKKQLQALDTFKAHLEQIVSDGLLEDFKATEKEQPTFLGDLNGT
jgi:hypothetical protein